MVTLLDDRPDAGLPRGEVGTIGETLDPATVLVALGDGEGRAFAVRPVPVDRLLPLHCEPAA